MLEGKARTQGNLEGDIVGDISLSIYDIYNKTVRDLVSGRQNLEKHLRETADGGWDFVERGTKTSLLQSYNVSSMAVRTHPPLPPRRRHSTTLHSMCVCVWLALVGTITRSCVKKGDEQELPACVLQRCLVRNPHSSPQPE
jgi:hypothetical protein